MKRFIFALMLVLFTASVGHAQGFSINPNAGAALILKDGKTTRIGEVLADVGYQFPMGEGNLWGELVALYGLGDQGNQLGGMGFRTYIQQGSVYPGFGVQAFVVDGGIADGVDNTAITLAPELLLEIPWSTESVLEDGTVVIDESMVAAYAAVYFPVSSSEDFTMVRFGIRAGI